MFKKFFNPTKYKVFIFLLLLIGGSYFGLTTICGPYEKCLPLSNFEKVINVISIIGPATRIFKKTNTDIVLILMLIMIYYYGLSCLIVMIINEFKKKNSN